MTRIKLFEMFAGVGGASFALKHTNIPFECIGYSETDKFASKVYDMNHPNIKNYGDCQKIIPEEIPDHDLLTAGFPCQPFSVAGRNKGTNDSRGILFNDILRIARVKQPSMMLLENVTGILSEKHKKFFEYILKSLEDINYEVIYFTLNSADYGIPQSRKRVWFVCRNKKHSWKEFKIPERCKLNTTLTNILEKYVDDKYFVREEVSLHTLCGFNNPKVSYCLDANYYKSTSVEGYFTKRRRQLVKTFCSDAVRSTQRGHIATLTDDMMNHTFRTNGIRRLTPTECFRLMGFNDDIILDGISDTQRYKMAGNGWDVHLAGLILKNMIDGAE